MSVAADPISALRAGLIVSVQTSPENPLHGSRHLPALVRAAHLGGAAAVRADTPEHVALARSATDLLVMGIYTLSIPGSEIRITPTFEAARALVDAGAQIVSVDGTSRRRPEGEKLAALIARIHEELGVPVMADVASVEDGRAARRAGADVVGSAVDGYERTALRAPDLALVETLVRELDCPVIAERHFTTVEQVEGAMRVGAHAVVVGSAIVDPSFAARRFVTAIGAAA